MGLLIAAPVYRLGVFAATTTTQRVASAVKTVRDLNTFHENASQLSEVGQNNIRILRGWAKSRQWQRESNPEGGPEKWGLTNQGKFEWYLIIKPEVSERAGLAAGSRLPRFEARLRLKDQDRASNRQFDYTNPFTGERGSYKDVSHQPLENDYFRY